MSRPAAALMRAFRSLGGQGALGLLLLVYALALGFGLLLPGVGKEQGLAEQVAQREARLAAEKRALARHSEASPESRLSEFYQAFPARDELLESLGTIYALADEQSLKLEQAQYKFAADSDSRLAHYEITLPLSGNYPQQRRFIEQALAELPALELRNLLFKRDGIDKENVETQLQFVLYVRSG